MISARLLVEALTMYKIACSGQNEGQKSEVPDRKDGRGEWI